MKYNKHPNDVAIQDTKNPSILPKSTILSAMNTPSGNIGNIDSIATIKKENSILYIKGKLADIFCK